MNLIIRQADARAIAITGESQVINDIHGKRAWMATQLAKNSLVRGCDSETQHPVFGITMQLIVFKLSACNPTDTVNISVEVK